MICTFYNSVGSQYHRYVELLCLPVSIHVEDIDLFPAKIDQKFPPVGAKGQVGGGQGAVALLVVLLSLGQVTWSMKQAHWLVIQP